MQLIAGLCIQSFILHLQRKSVLAKKTSKASVEFGLFPNANEIEKLSLRKTSAAECTKNNTLERRNYAIQ